MSAEVAHTRIQHQRYVQLMEQAYSQHEALCHHLDQVLDENQKLKESILGMTMLLNQAHTILAQSKSDS